MARNVHERRVQAPIEEVGPLLDRLGGPADALWPSPDWPPMVLDGPVGLGAAGGHGPFRYRVTAHQPGRCVEFTADPGQHLQGTHTFTAEPAGPGATTLRHVLDARTSGPLRLGWPLAVRWLHDTVVEEIFDNAERAVARGPARPVRRSCWVRLLRRFTVERAVPADVPRSQLVESALPRVDWADAHAVPARPGTPTDPQAWADAVFRDPPRWVLALLGMRELLVGLVGIERDGGTAFDTLARTADEVLLGTDAGHLDFRVIVRREPERVVLTTVVRVHNRRGRAYDVLVRRVHPVVVRAMLTRAAHRLPVTGRVPRPTGGVVVAPRRWTGPSGCGARPGGA